MQIYTFDIINSSQIRFMNLLEKNMRTQINQILLLLKIITG